MEEERASRASYPKGKREGAGRSRLQPAPGWIDPGLQGLNKASFDGTGRNRAEQCGTEP